MRINFHCDLSQRLGNQWFVALDRIADELGYFENLGPHHFATFLDAGPKLLVTFEIAPEIWENSRTREPRGFDFVRHDGWSHLALIAKDASWFRQEQVYRYFDRLTDEGFLEDFDQILFYGSGPCGYAAAAFSVAAPGAHVLLLAPQATLDPRLTAFDTRYRSARKQDFNTRYGFAPDMIEASQHTYIAFDPYNIVDATHAALFRRSNVTYLRCPMLGQHLEHSLDKLNVSTPLMHAAMNGSLSSQGFAQLIRQRKSLQHYKQSLFDHLIKRNRPRLARKVASLMPPPQDNNAASTVQSSEAPVSEFA